MRALPGVFVRPQIALDRLQNLARSSAKWRLPFLTIITVWTRPCNLRFMDHGGLVLVLGPARDTPPLHRDRTGPAAEQKGSISRGPADIRGPFDRVGWSFPTANFGGRPRAVDASPGHVPTRACAACPPFAAPGPASCGPVAAVVAVTHGDAAAGAARCMGLLPSSPAPTRSESGRAPTTVDGRGVSRIVCRLMGSVLGVGRLVPVPS